MHSTINKARNKSILNFIFSKAFWAVMAGANQFNI